MLRRRARTVYLALTGAAIAAIEPLGALAHNVGYELVGFAAVAAVLPRRLPAAARRSRRGKPPPRR